MRQIEQRGPSTRPALLERTSDMTRTLLPFLGTAARAARSVGLGGVVRTVRDAADAAFSVTGIPPFRLRVDGCEIRGYLRHRSFLESVANGHEAFSRGLFEEALKPGMTVVDGGAHIGLYSLLASRRVGVYGTVIAFEPDPYNYRTLVLNARANRCGNLVILQKALSDTSGKRQFFQYPSTISSSLVHREGVDRGLAVEIETAALDTELPALRGSSVLVKLDIEGAEVLALRGMRDFLRRQDRVVLFLEVHPSILCQAGFVSEDVLHELEALGFRVHLVDESRHTLLPVHELPVLGKAKLYGTRGE